MRTGTDASGAGRGADFWALKSRRVVCPGGIVPGVVLIRGARIEAVAPPNEVPQGTPTMDAGDWAVMPGLVDSHVHINEPGRAAWEGFDTATRAAAAGGVTSLVDMPLNSIPAVTEVSALETKLSCARSSRLWVDCGFWGGVVPGNAGSLEGMLDAGAAGFKAFLIDSGVPEFPPVGEGDLRAAMAILARRGAPLLVHAELCGPGGPGQPGSASRAPRVYANYLATRPKAWENDAVSLLIRLCRETGCRTHVVHLSSAEAARLVRKARQEGLPLTAETCPHYLFFDAEEVPEGRTEFKCAPPVREKENRERLWEFLADGTIGLVVSDHSPCVEPLKLADSGDFLGAWGGISSLQLGLAAVWTQAERRGFGLGHLARWMSEAPARLAGLPGKGMIAAGADADLALVSPEDEFAVSAGSLYQRQTLTPYLGRRLKGSVKMTVLGGRIIYENGAFDGPFGRPLLRGGVRPAAGSGLV